MGIQGPEIVLAFFGREGKDDTTSLNLQALASNVGKAAYFMGMCA